MHMTVDATWHHKQAAPVDDFLTACQLVSRRSNLAIANSDVSANRICCCNNCSTANDKIKI
jgi:hypothetical protein